MKVLSSLVDNSPAVMRQMKQNIAAALGVMGRAGLELTLDAMNNSYHKPVFLTGRLQRSMTFTVDTDRQTTTWGSELYYAPFVHEGTSRMASRPFLIDGLLNNKDILLDAAAGELKRGFDSSGTDKPDDSL